MADEEKLVPAGQPMSDIADNEWDVIMVYPYEKPEDVHDEDGKSNKEERDKMAIRNKLRHGIISRLQYANLICKLSLSRDEDEVFVRITATEDRLDDCAEDIGMEMKLNDDYKDPTTGLSGYDEFTKKKYKEGLFRGAGYYENGQWVSSKQLFSSLERQRLIFHILEDSKQKRGADLDLDKLKRKGIITACFPMHDDQAKQHLMKEWVSGVFKPQPLDDVRDYFGEKYALYFAWLGFYTNMLIFPAALGSIVFAYGFTKTENPHTHVTETVGVDNRLVPFYCIFLSIWSTVFLELWKRRNAELAYTWDVMDFEEEEKPRAEYLESDIPVEVNGFWGKGGFIPVEADDNIHKTMTTMGKKIPSATVMPATLKMLYYGLSVSLILPSVFAIVIGTLAILWLRGVLQNNFSPTAGAAVAGCMNAAFIGVGNSLYKKLAVWLNNKETHRTDTEYEDHLILKCFFFQFVNSYISLFYIAFIKSNEFVLFGQQDYCHDMTKTADGQNNFNKSPQEIKDENNGYNPHCMRELFTQLMTLVVIKQIVDQFKELGIPAMKQKYKIYKEEQEIKKNLAIDGEEPPEVEPMDPWEEQSKLEEADGTFDEYNEMVIQYGYVTLFAAAFPIASLASLVNNLVEIRTDAANLLKFSQRPPYQGCEDIGSWQKILEIQSLIAVITNVCIVGFTSATLKITYFRDYSDQWQMKVYVLWTVVIMEHAILLFKWLLAELIDDIPEKIVKAMARQEFEKDLTIKLYEGGEDGEEEVEVETSKDIKLEEAMEVEFDVVYGDLSGASHK